MNSLRSYNLHRSGDGWNDDADDADDAVSADDAGTADPDGETCITLSTVVLTSMLDISKVLRKTKKIYASQTVWLAKPLLKGASMSKLFKVVVENDAESFERVIEAESSERAVELAGVPYVGFSASFVSVVDITDFKEI